MSDLYRDSKTKGNAGPEAEGRPENMAPMAAGSVAGQAGETFPGRESQAGAGTPGQTAGPQTGSRRSRKKDAKRQAKADKKEAAEGRRKEKADKKQLKKWNKEAEREISIPEKAWHPDGDKKKRLSNRNTPAVIEKLPPYSDDPDDDVFLERPLPYSTAMRLIPVSKIQDGIFLKKDSNRYVKLMDVTPSNFSYKGYQEQSEIIGNFYAMLSVAPSRIHIKSFATPMDISAYFSYMEGHMEVETNVNCRALMRDLVEFLSRYASRNAIQRRFTLAVDWAPARRIPDKDQEIRLAVQELGDIERRCRSDLQRCGNTVREFDNPTQEFASQTYQVLNREMMQTVPFNQHFNDVADYYVKEYGENSEAMIPLTDLMAPMDIEFHAKYSVINGLYYTWLYIPCDGYVSDGVNMAWTSRIINLGSGIDVDFFFEREPANLSASRIRRMINRTKGELHEANEESDSTFMASSRLASGRYLRDAIRNGQSIWYASILITVTAKDKKDLDWRVTQLRNELVKWDASLNMVLFEQEDAYKSTLPFGWISRGLQNKSMQNVTTKDLSAWYPFASYEFTADTGIPLGMLRNSSMVIVDLFDDQVYTNANVGILGQSGSGKTYLLLLLAARFRMIHTRVFVMIPEKPHEWQRLCQAIGGTFISIGPQSKDNINIMDIRKRNDEVQTVLYGETYSSRMREKIETLHTWLKLRVQHVSEVEDAAFDTACIAAYAEYGITEDNGSLADPGHPGNYKAMPTIGTVQKYLKQSADGQRLATILSREVDGTASVYNQPTNVCLDDMFTVIDVSGLRKSDLLASSTFMALSLMLDIAKENVTEKIILEMDELWSLISLGANSDVAFQIVEAFKVLRGYGGGVIYATQDVSDHDSEAGRAILAACETKFIMKMKKEQAEAAQHMIGLSDAETKGIISAERGSALLCASTNHMEVKVAASPLEHRLFTTSRTDLEKMYNELSSEQDWPGYYGADAGR